jgi:hypothetical protein
MHAKIVWTLAYDKEPTQNTRLLPGWESRGLMISVTLIYEAVYFFGNKGGSLTLEQILFKCGNAFNFSLDNGGF